MRDVSMNLLVALVVAVLVFVGFVIGALTFGNCRLIYEPVMVKKGYARYEFNPTNGTSKFVWKDLKEELRDPK